MLTKEEERQNFLKMTDYETKEELINYVTEFTIGDYKIAWRGKGWGIYESNFSKACYNQFEKCFDYELMPSSRDAAFFRDCRFTLSRARQIVEELMK